MSSIEERQATLRRGFAGAIGPAQIAVVEGMREFGYTEEEAEKLRSFVADRLNDIYSKGE